MRNNLTRRLCIGGVIAALCQRLREIGRRDEDAVEKY